MKLTRILGFAFAMASAPALAQPGLAPEALVKKVTDDVLQAIQNDKALQAGDRKKALALAEQKILPHVDFREATLLAMGRSWHTATPEVRVICSNSAR